MSAKMVVAFVLGLGVGGGATYLFTKKSLENWMNEEIDSVKEYYKTQLDEMEAAIKNEDEEIEWNEIDEDFEENDEKTVKIDPKTAKNEPNYQEIIRKLDYGEYSKKEKEEQEAAGVRPKKEEPYIITADEFAQSMAGEQRTFTYYEEDGVFLDENYDIVTNGVELVGEENLDHFSEEEEDVLYVRNNETREDYEVLLEHIAYAESEYFDHGDD